MQIQMTDVPELRNVQIIPSTFVNGALANYQITIQAETPLINNDKFVFRFPVEPKLPNTGSSLVCQIGSGIDTVTCSKSGTLVTALFTFTGNAVASGGQFTFTINDVTNPGSTQPSSAFTDILMTSSLDANINKYTSSVIVTMTTPGTPTAVALT